MLNKKIKIPERYFFFLILILNLLPVLLYKFVPTSDGVAHLYNSKIINHLLFNDNSMMSTFFAFNNEAVPNWTGHAALSFFSLLLPGFLAEKMFLILYLVALPLAFRALVKTVSPGNVLYSYFIFPFTYSFTFFLGFYNFLISLVFLILTMNFWIKNEGNMVRFRNVLKLSALLLLTYFSHVFVFALLLFFIGLRLVVKTIADITANPVQMKKNLVPALKKCAILLGASAIPMLLLYFYTGSRSYNDIVYVNKASLLAWLKNIRPYVTLDVVEKARQELFTKMLFYLLCTNALIALYNRINKSVNAFSNSGKLTPAFVFKNVFTIHDFWMLAAIITLCFYFFLPDSYGSGSYISIRFSVIFFILLIVWLATQEFARWFALLSVLVVLICNFSLNASYSAVFKKLNEIAADCNNAAKYVSPNNVVLPYNCTEDDTFNHFSNYIGIDKPVILMENYESSKNYFPVRWNEREMPKVFLGNVFSELPLTDKPVTYNPAVAPVIADYVFIIGNLEKLNNRHPLIAEKVIAESYTKIYNTPNCSLYKRISK